MLQKLEDLAFPVTLAASQMIKQFASRNSCSLKMMGLGWSTKVGQKVDTFAVCS